MMDYDTNDDISCLYCDRQIDLDLVFLETSTYSAGVGVGVGVLVAEGLIAVSVAGPHRARKHRAGSLRISE